MYDNDDEDVSGWRRWSGGRWRVNDKLVYLFSIYQGHGTDSGHSLAANAVADGLQQQNGSVNAIR